MLRGQVAPPFCERVAAGSRGLSLCLFRRAQAACLFYLSTDLESNMRRYDLFAACRWFFSVSVPVLFVLVALPSLQARQEPEPDREAIRDQPIVDRELIFADPYNFENLPPLPEIDVPSEEQINAAINKGVKFLLETQNRDGSFGSPTPRRDYEIYAPVPGAHHAFQSATTALCVSTLLEIKPTDTELADQIPAAIERADVYLKKKLPKLRRAQGDAIYNVWGHAYSIRAFVRLMQRPDVSDEQKNEYRELIAQQIQLLGKYESVDGGWGYYDFRYEARQPTSDSISFVNATGLIAFYEARQAGVEVPQKLIDRAVAATLRQQKPDLSYLYGEYLKGTPLRGINNPGGSLARSQACNLAMRLWGDQKITDNVFKYWLIRLYLRNGWLSIARKMPVPHSSHMQVSGYFYYYGHYYAGQVIDLLPPEERAPYQSMLARLMIDHQQPNGAWWDYPLYDYHRQYGTAYALMALARCLPGEKANNLGTLRETPAVQKP